MLKDRSTGGKLEWNGMILRNKEKVKENETKLKWVSWVQKKEV